MRCYCGSSLSYQECCQPLHLGTQTASSAEQLMRSRYCAYAIGCYQYVHATTHPSQQTEGALREITEFGQHTGFLKLQVLLSADEASAFSRLQSADFTNLPTHSEQCSYVHFQATLLSDDRIGLLDEVSRFVLYQQRWFYLDGHLLPYQSTKIGRNDPCPCGSGLKFKQCRSNHHRPK